MLLLSTGSLNTYGLPRVFGLAKEAGFDGVEIMIDRRWDGRHPDYLRQLSEEHDLPIQVLHNPFVPDVEGWPSDQLGRLHRTLAMAQALRVPTITTHLPLRLHMLRLEWGGPRPRRFVAPLPGRSRDAYYDLLRDGGLAALEAKTGVTIGVENMPARRFFGRTVDLYWFNTLDALAGFRHLVLDTTHCGTWGMDPSAVWARLKDRVVHVHLSNYADGVEHRPPPDGELDLAGFLRRLAADGYRGAVTVEGEPFGLHADDEKACAAELRRAVEFCRMHLSSW